MEGLIFGILRYFVTAVITNTVHLAVNESAAEDHRRSPDTELSRTEKTANRYDLCFDLCFLNSLCFRGFPRY